MAQDAYDMTIGAGVGQAKLVLLDVYKKNV